MIVDFSSTRSKPNTISILGEENVVDDLEYYRYLGIHLDSRLIWKCNTEALYNRGQTAIVKEA